MIILIGAIIYIIGISTWIVVQYKRGIHDRYDRGNDDVREK